jgi:hypothetical protein
MYSWVPPFRFDFVSIHSRVAKLFDASQKQHATKKVSPHYIAASAYDHVLTWHGSPQSLFPAKLFAHYRRPCRDPPAKSAFFPLVGKSPAVADCVVAHAVACEPVFTRQFPATREIYREFCRIRPISAILKADTRANSKACGKIPYATELGNILKEQGIPAENQGILPAKTKIGAG